MDKGNPENPCHIVLPYSQFETRNNEPNSSMRQVSVGDEIDETHGRCRGPLMIVDMIPKSDRNHIATSLGLELQDGDQNDDIGYMKKKFLSVILKKLSGKSDKRTQDWPGVPWIPVELLLKLRIIHHMITIPSLLKK
ncbi:uncharacterized protein OCT59_018119 [Rhizophagus irregularis]|uniref:uncharacterized protein n=1 Tax=Rhizophagus irregularis TaxID=588596 RepID=UPI000CA8362D|nr:hypothetical protein OCT59_018119 [Rhizophagus irregularis]